MTIKRYSHTGYEQNLMEDKAGNILLVSELRELLGKKIKQLEGELIDLKNKEIAWKMEEEKYTEAEIIAICDGACMIEGAQEFIKKELLADLQSSDSANLRTRGSQELSDCGRVNKKLVMDNRVVIKTPTHPKNSPFAVGGMILPIKEKVTK